MTSKAHTFTVVRICLHPLDICVWDGMLSCPTSDTRHITMCIRYIELSLGLRMYGQWCRICAESELSSSHAHAIQLVLLWILEYLNVDIWFATNDKDILDIVFSISVTYWWCTPFIIWHNYKQGIFWNYFQFIKCWRINYSTWRNTWGRIKAYINGNKSCVTLKVVLKLK